MKSKTMPKLPRKVDLCEMYDIPVFDQGGLGSATCCGMASMMGMVAKSPKPKRTRRTRKNAT